MTVVLSAGTKRINLGSSNFKNFIKDRCVYIDKSAFIEHFLDDVNTAQLVVRQRRLGKSLNLSMLKLFLTDLEDNRGLFEGLYVRDSHVWEQANSAPVFYFDFKQLREDNYAAQVVKQMDIQLRQYVNPESLVGAQRITYDNMLQNPDTGTDCLLLLTELVYQTTGKQSYILIDEYDKLLTDSYDKDSYEEIKSFETALLSAGLKGNDYLEKAMLTGVMRVSRESILSGLNNLFVYELFDDSTYTDDFGLTEEDIDELNKHYGFDKQELKDWYNGIRINGKAIYNLYSVMSYLKTGNFDNYWGQSGTLNIIRRLLNTERKATLEQLLQGETASTRIENRISLRDLGPMAADEDYYSLIVQAGYLSVEEETALDTYNVRIPNIELMNVWKSFILKDVTGHSADFIKLFNNLADPQAFAWDTERMLNGKLSFFDLNPDDPEAAYHGLVLGILSIYDNIVARRPLSNREAGYGRYDVLFEWQCYSIIFEFKQVDKPVDLEEATKAALGQIDAKRYYADVPANRTVVKCAIAFCGKQCKAVAT
jgi:hypothetical protein